jgi:hypothetical protein
MSIKSQTREERVSKQKLLAMWNYLNAVAHNQQYTNVNTDTMGNPGTVRFEAFKPIGQTGHYAAIELTLFCTPNCQMWVVMQFNVNLHGSGGGIEKVAKLSIMSGIQLLTHYGKLPADEQIHLKRPDETVWKIYNARDLESLFEAYDRVAEIFGCIAIFTH